MGTYTTNYQLFMPTIGEQGWGDLVNGNFTTIDATLKGFDDILSKMTWDGDNVTFPGSVTANGGFNLEIATESNVISGFKLTSKILLLSGSSGNKTFEATKTYIYKANPLCNTVQFNYVMTHNYANRSGGSCSITINGTPFYSTGNITTDVNANTDMVTLNDGDVVQIDISGYYSSGSAVSVTCNLYVDGYLVNA